MTKRKVVPIEDRIPKLKKKRRQRTNRLFVMYLLVFFLLILSVLYFQSPYSKVSTIKVKGNNYVTDEEIIQLSEITKETKIWKIDSKKTEKLLKKNKEIKNATVNRQFPNNILIQVDEYKRIAYLIKESKTYPILENGKILAEMGEQDNTPADAPLLINWKNGDELQEMAAELKKIPNAILNLISEIHLQPTETDPLHVTLFMNDGNQVSGTIRDFAEKMLAYPAIVGKLPGEQKGLIDLEVGYYFTPFEKLKEKEVTNDES